VHIRRNPTQPVHWFAVDGLCYLVTQGAYVCSEKESELQGV
jgi:hypothetical protein